MTAAPCPPKALEGRNIRRWMIGTSSRRKSYSLPSRGSRRWTTSSCGPTSTPTSIRTRRRETGRQADRGLLDTSVAVRLGLADPSELPCSAAISTLTLAELAAGPHAVSDQCEQRRRRLNLRRIENAFVALPFDAACAHAFARIYVAVIHAGRKPRGARTVDLMIAATALAHALPLYTLNAADLRGLEDLVEIVDLGSLRSR